ncbi:hypothetical protein H2200_004725 [Cladophialophora chaetospira]|uniref:Pre-rRNA-processing protein RIX1 n=1 Tax=Cladophialophora chaetospira TaxID=386627 RepID=A0AA38XDM4_9EURO|nr:hypothetical protein H2200_004725 [Cladophialophora chaetospira]
MQHDSALRAIVTRLTVTPVEDLPRISGFLASGLAQCSLEDQFSDNKKSGASSVTAHKLRTRITSLLQDRTTAGRFTAAVLIKAVVDRGGSNVLSSSEVWARSLLSCLNKPDPLDVKKVYLATVTRIFVLTQNHATLLREVTTPLLPPFITICLGLIRPVQGSTKEVVNPLLDSVLQCWNLLLPRHATIFRPFVVRMKLVAQRLLEDAGTSSFTKELAGRLSCLLISCAPKNTAPQEWTRSATNIISSAHQTADRLFRAVLEEYEPSDTSNQRPIGKHSFSKEIRVADKDQLELNGWTGIQEGSNRLATLIEWLRNLIMTPTSQSVEVPLGAILDLSSRILGVVPPESRSNTTNTLRYHKEATREEKEQLWLNLPQIHTPCLRLLQSLDEIFGQSILAVDGAIISQVHEVFQVMSGQEPIREVVYKIFTRIVDSIDLSELHLSHTSMSALVELCCVDLKRELPTMADTTNAKTSKDGFLSTKSVAPAGGQLHRKPSKVYQAAWALLPRLITHCPGTSVSRQVRIEMDRLSVLLDHNDAMLASVMRPTPSDEGSATVASLLPFLARSAADNIATEALLRPRMPVVQVNGSLAQLPQINEDLTVEEEPDEQSNESSDILSKLENSRDALQDTFESNEQTPLADNGTALHHNGAEGPSDATKKRTIDAVDSHHVGSPVGAQLLPPRELKMPRLEEKETALTKERTTDADTERPQLGTFTALVDFGSTREGILREDTAPRHPPINIENDSDDSEIPEIDPSLDTDEEDSE